MSKDTRSPTSTSMCLRLRPHALLPTLPRPSLSSCHRLAPTPSRMRNIPRTMRSSSSSDSRPRSMVAYLRPNMPLRAFASLCPSLHSKPSPHPSSILPSSVWAREPLVLPHPASLSRRCLRKHLLHLSSPSLRPLLRRRPRPRLPSLGRRSVAVSGSRAQLHWPAPSRRLILQMRRRRTARPRRQRQQFDERASTRQGPVSLWRM